MFKVMETPKQCLKSVQSLQYRQQSNVIDIVLLNFKRCSEVSIVDSEKGLLSMVI